MIRLKTEAELAGIRKSCRLLARLFEELGQRVEPGVTTKSLDDFSRDYIRSHGGEPAFLGYQGFPYSVCASLNEQVIHGFPNTRPLQEGDILSLDIGINLNGFISDSAHTFPVGKVSEEAQTLMDVTRQSLYAAIDVARAGNRVRDISRAVQDTVSPYGYGIVHDFCGHGVGIELHEDPQIPNYYSRGASPRLRKGMVIAVEPMINRGTGDVNILDDGWTVVTADGKLSAHFEHTLAIHADHAEILTELNQ